MQPLSRPPFRAEHIGSLLRPPELLRAREQQHAAGQLDRGALRAIENDAIRDVVKLQEEVGLKVITDGEFRRGTYSDSFTSSGISGVSVELTEDAGLDQIADPRSPHGAAHPAGGRPHRLERTAERQRLPVSQIGDQRARPRSPCPAPATSTIAPAARNISRDVYPDLDTFWSDLVDGLSCRKCARSPRPAAPICRSTRPRW